MLNGTFFQWCEKRGLIDPTLIAKAFRMSAPTVRTWRKAPAYAVLPPWVELACDAHDGLVKTGGALDLDDMTPARFAAWRRRHRLFTLADVGAVFGISKQAVGAWQKRGGYPAWLALACAGHDVRKAA